MSKVASLLSRAAEALRYGTTVLFLLSANQVCAGDSEIIFSFPGNLGKWSELHAFTCNFHPGMLDFVTGNDPNTNESIPSGPTSTVIDRTAVISSSNDLTIRLLRASFIAANPTSRHASGASRYIANASADVRTDMEMDSAELFAMNTAQKDSTMPGNPSVGGQDIPPTSVVHSGWVQNLPASWHSFLAPTQ